MGCAPTAIEERAPSLPRQSTEVRPTHPGVSFLASAVLPGLGQRLLGQDRWTLYAAAEIWSWVQYHERRRDGRRLRRNYRDLAWLVARRVSSGPRTDGSFEYYETLSHYVSSGAFDRDPHYPGVQPETDPETYNGVIWGLASEIFFPEDSPGSTDPGSPAYEQALAYYQSRAYPPSLAWNWGSNLLQQLEYRDLIRASDENLRRSTTMIGVILANHLLSAVDGLISGRLRAPMPPEGHAELLFLPTPLGTEAVGISIHLPLPRVP